MNRVKELTGKGIRSVLMIGAGFTGINLIVNMMNSQLGPAANAMSERFGLSLSVVDVGWQGASPMTWASGFAALAIPLAILLNIIMLVMGLTKTVNIDMWNIWHIGFTGAIAYFATGKMWAGVLGILFHAAVIYKLGDLWAPYIEGYFELPGITIPNGTSAYMAPIACLVELLIEKIPGLRQVNFSIDSLQERAGVLAEPAVIGGILGTAIGLLAGYEPGDAFRLGIQMAAVMVLMPPITKCIMEGLLPISEYAKKFLGKRFGTGEFYIGLDPSILLGDSQVVTAGLLFIPITLLLAMLVPGNQVLPFGDLATISFFIAISVAIHKGNLFRTLISGSVIMYMTIWITNQTVPWVSALAINAGTITEGNLTAAMDQGGSPLTYIFTELFTRDNILGLIVLMIIYGSGLWAAVKCSRKEKETDNYL